jgi:hypothetical protein
MTRRDPVTPELREAVLERDGWACVGRRLWMPGKCNGRLELDHIANLGLSLRGPSTMANLVTLCSWHHRIKTDNGRTWRPLLLAYVDGKSSSSSTE